MLYLWKVFFMYIYVYVICMKGMYILYFYTHMCVAVTFTGWTKMPLNHTFLPSQPPRNKVELSKMINFDRNSKTSTVSKTFMGF